MRAWAVAALDLVFPAHCPVCESMLGAGRRDPLCGTCWDAIERIGPPLCETCGLPFPSLVPRAAGDPPVGGHGRCGECAAVPPAFVATTARPPRIASSTVTGRPSRTEESTNRSAASIRSATS